MSNTNNTNDLFIIAARKKFRFASNKGHLCAEDLFDLSLTSLDAVAVAIDEQVQKVGRKSFINKRADSTKDIEDALSIVKFVIETKQDEIEAKKTRAEKAARRQFLNGLKDKKAMQEMEGMTLAEIEKELAEV